MKLIKEFKEFAARGNVIDLAVGVIVGASFGKIVSSLVSDIFMPALGVLIGGVNFTHLKIILKEASTDSAGKAVAEVALTYGNFLQSLFDFLIIMFCIFLMIKGINSLKKPEKKADTQMEKLEKEEVALLTEIRDLLKK